MLHKLQLLSLEPAQPHNFRFPGVNLQYVPIIQIFSGICWFLSKFDRSLIASTCFDANINLFLCVVFTTENCQFAFSFGKVFIDQGKLSSSWLKVQNTWFKRFQLSENRCQMDTESLIQSTKPITVKDHLHRRDRNNKLGTCCTRLPNFPKAIYSQNSTFEVPTFCASSNLAFW